jgi:putative protease
VDALIISDPGIFSIARSIAPKLSLHISTQANNTNWASAQFWQSQGAKRIVLARELSLAEMRGIREKTNLELEAFVHGAMCISYSGRCLLSNYLTGRDANRGECAQACRWKYSVVEETRPGQYFPVLEDERGAYVFNSRDLCLLPHIDDLIAAGLDSFKIEGRMKSVHYVATVVKIYRQAIDTYCADPSGFAARPEWLTELAKISHRAYTKGFAFAKTTAADQIYGDRTYHQTHDFVGLVHSYDPVGKTAIVEQRNNMKTGETIEFMRPDQPNFQQTITRMTDLEGNELSVAPHAQQLVRMNVLQPVAPFSMLRRPVNT